MQGSAKTVRVRAGTRSASVAALLVTIGAFAQQPGGGGGTPITTNLAPPPEKYTITPGGVDILTGRYAYDRTDLSIGAGSGELTLRRILSTALGGHIDPFANFSHNWDITLIEKRVDMSRNVFWNGTGQDFRMTVNFDGRSDTFQKRVTAISFTHPSDSPFSRLVAAGDPTTAGVIYTYTMSGGTRVIFRPLGGNDCALGVRCAYPSQVIRADGTTFSFQYDVQATATSNKARMRSVVSNHGYALLLEYAGTGASWNFVTKACVLNLSQTPKPANNVCPAGAVATTSYTYTSFGSAVKLASARDALGATSGYSYAVNNNPQTAVPISGLPSYLMSYRKPGQSAPWQVATVVMFLNRDQEQSQIVAQQSFADGSGYSYGYTLTPRSSIEGETREIAGGRYTDALGHFTRVEFGFPILPGPLNQPAGPDDIVYQMTSGPIKIVDPLGRATRLDYCDPLEMAILPPSVVNRCLVTHVQSSTTPEGIKTFYTISLGHLIGTRTVAKPGFTAPDIVRSAGDGCGGATLVTCGKPPTVTDANGNVSNYTYHSTHGGVLTETLPAPIPGGIRPQKRYTYTQLYAWYRNASGTVVQAATPVWRLTGISECRTLASCANTADETRTTITYGSPGTPNNLLATSITVAAGDGSVTATTTKTYDLQGNALTVNGPLPGATDTTRSVYDALRRVVGEITPDPDGAGPLPYRALRRTYNAAGDLVSVERGTVLGQSNTDWPGFSALQATTSQYDSQGRKTRQSLSAAGVTYGVTQFSYDLAGRLDCTAVRLDPAQWNSQTNACVPQTSGPQGPDRVSRNFYDAAGELLRKQVAVGTADQADVEIYTYTPDGKLGSVRDGESNLTSYEYDGFDRLQRTRYPVPTQGALASSTSDFEQLSYDPNGNITQRRLRDGQTIGFTYDQLDRNTLKSLPSPEASVDYAYDLQGHLLSATQGSADISRTYDALGRMLTESAAKGTMSYQYDPAGRRTRTTWPDGFFVTQDFLVTGEVAAIRESGAASGAGVLAIYAYDDWGRRTSLTRGNGVVTTYSFDAAGRLQSLVNDLSGTADDQTLTFGYNTAGQITTRTNSNSAYDSASPAPPSTETYTPNGLNQYTGVAAVSLTYDARGNTTYDGTKNYTYDSSNRLTGVSGGVTLSYDPLGRLYQINTGSRLFDGDNIVGQYSGTTLLNRHVHGPRVDEPLVQYSGTGTSSRSFFVADERGSIVAGTDNAGVRVYTNRYDEYGRPQAGNVGLYQYTGQVWITSVGLAHYKTRMYSPKLGRFLQTDPIGYQDDINLYAYVGNDPIDRTDPSGTEGACFGSPCGEIPDVTAGQAVGTLADFTPVVGDIKGVVEAIQNPTAVSIAAAVIGIVPVVGDVAKKGGNIIENAAKGKAGEAVTRANLGSKVAGEQVSFKTNDGTRTRTDFVTKNKGVVETKTGNAALSSGQAKLKADIDAGRTVTPVGRNAANADLRPGEPTKMISCTIDRPPCR